MKSHPVETFSFRLCLSTNVFQRSHNFPERSFDHCASMMDNEKRTTSMLLALGVAVPILYFGMQLAAAPFCADYSFMRRDASTLGSAESTRPWIFNGGSFLLGVIMIAASVGFWKALTRHGVRPWLATATAITIAMGGLGSINAALFPLPDPRHTGGMLAIVGSGLLLAPLALTVAVWRLKGQRLLRGYLTANLAVMAALVPIIGGLIQRWAMHANVQLPRYQEFLNTSQGLLQRVAAGVAFLPIGVSAYCLRRQQKRRG
jgi:hypothetical protein